MPLNHANTLLHPHTLTHATTTYPHNHTPTPTHCTYSYLHFKFLMSFTLLTIENQRYCILYFYRKGTPQGVSPNQNLIQEKKQIQYISQIFWIAPRQLRLHRATCRLVYNVYNYKLHTGIIVHLYIRLLFSWWCVGREHILESRSAGAYRCGCGGVGGSVCVFWFCFSLFLSWFY